jgi:hypothetical protein
MLYDVRLWLSLASFECADIACRVDALGIEDAALLALRLSGLLSAAYASVVLVGSALGGTVARAWGPVDCIGLQADCEVSHG